MAWHCHCLPDLKHQSVLLGKASQQKTRIRLDTTEKSTCQGWPHLDCFCFPGKISAWSDMIILIQHWLFCRCSFLSPWFRSAKAWWGISHPKTNGRMKGAKKGKRWHWMLKRYHSPYTSHLPFPHEYTYKEMLLLTSKHYKISFKRFIAEMPGKLELQTHCFVYT